MAKQLVANYSYSKAGKTVTLTDWATVRLDRLLLIVDATINTVMYNFADTSVSATVATNVITLSAVPGASADSDKLLIFYDALTADTTYDRIPTSPIASQAGVDGNSGNKSAATQRVVLATDQPALTNALLTTQTPATSGGLTIHSAILGASTNATSVKGSAGQLYGYQVTNLDATPIYLKLYNTSGTPTAGSGTPVLRLMVPGNGSGAGIIAAEFVSGIAFSSGIGYTCTTGITDADTGALSANEVLVNLLYK